MTLRTGAKAQIRKEGNAYAVFMHSDRYRAIIRSHKADIASLAFDYAEANGNLDGFVIPEHTSNRI
jgi:hypothetical protein